MVLLFILHIIINSKNYYFISFMGKLVSDGLNEICGFLCFITLVSYWLCRNLWAWRWVICRQLWLLMWGHPLLLRYEGIPRLRGLLQLRISQPSIIRLQRVWGHTLGTRLPRSFLSNEVDLLAFCVYTLVDCFQSW